MTTSSVQVSRLRYKRKPRTVWVSIHSVVSKKSYYKLNQIVIVELTEIFDVILVESIYYPIYLVPKFEIQDDIKTTVAHHKLLMTSGSFILIHI